VQGLAEDFRQVCYPIRCLENNARRCNGQLFEGRQTRIDWSADRITLPTMPDAACDGVNVGGSTVTVAGITGRLRGQSHMLAAGRIIRPELVLIDDPQTREAAMSPSQSEARARIISGDVLGMAGPGKKIAALMPCTVIRSGDLADRLLDRAIHPQWQGERTKLVYSFPTNEKLWEAYAQKRAESFRNEGDGSEATEFYRKNKAAMDAGAAVAWPERFNADELSAIQHAMNLKFRDEYAFSAEYQNEPKTDAGGAVDMPTAEAVAAKVNGLGQGVVPVGATHLTAFIDVQKAALFYAVCAWADDFTGWVIDYGVYPEQGVDYFLLRDLKATLAMAHPEARVEGAIRAGLDKLTARLMGREWKREDGTPTRVERCLVDAGWGESTALVHDFCRASVHAASLMASKGWGIGAAKRPMMEWPKKPGERVGHNWRIPIPQDRRVTRHVIFDTNFWKSFVMTGLSTSVGDRGCLSLFGRKPERHRMIADHLTAEYPVRTAGYGRSLDEWKLRPERPDNHLLDACVGCAVAASMQGVRLEQQAAHDTAAPVARKRVKASDLQRAKRGY
jgi:phage terminase large subunit GpA-like protein